MNYKNLKLWKKTKGKNIYIKNLFAIYKKNTFLLLNQGISYFSIIKHELHFYSIHTLDTLFFLKMALITVFLNSCKDREEVIEVTFQLHIRSSLLLHHSAPVGTSITSGAFITVRMALGISQLFVLLNCAPPAL